MVEKIRDWRSLPVVLATVVFLAGCSSTLIQDAKKSVPESAARCEGSASVNDSSIAILPIPIVAFFVPHIDVNEIRAEDYVNRCGDRKKLENRKVVVSKTACIPAALTRFLTLGVWQWCPATVSWEADVVD